MCFRQCQYIRGQRKADTDSSGLKVASRHFAGLAVTLQIETDLLAFDELAHSGAFNGRDMDERIGAAIVRLNEAEALGGIEPFNCASGHDEPFIAVLRSRNAKALQMVIAIFERKVRSERGANRALTKASKQNIDKHVCRAFERRGQRLVFKPDKFAGRLSDNRSCIPRGEPRLRDSTRRAPPGACWQSEAR
jgi:hypothetical protein